MWAEQAQATFEALNQALTFTTLLSPPNFTKEFILYVSTFENSTIGVIVQEDDALQENVIYYVSHKIFGPLLRYSHVEKMTLVIVFFSVETMPLHSHEMKQSCVQFQHHELSLESPPSLRSCFQVDFHSTRV